MSNHVRTLMQYTPVECLRRIELLTSERSRKQVSLPAKTFAWVSVVLSLLAVGLNAGFTSMPFILLVICTSLLAGIALLELGGSNPTYVTLWQLTACSPRSGDAR